MAITYRPEEKYAFLFTGPTLAPFVKDIENVFQTLTDYYNYPPANIRVVLGSATAMPSVPGATVTTIATTTDLQTELSTFSTATAGPAPSGGWNSAVLFFTGGGILDGSTAKLTIDDDPAGANNVDPAWLTTRLNAFVACHVNLVMQQSYAGGFVSALTGSTLAQGSITYACGAGEQSVGNAASGGFFTDGWVRGLRLESLPAGTPDAGSYADELGSAGEAGNRQIALQEAMEFGQQILDVTAIPPVPTPGYSETGGTQYPGLPAFLIRDGSPWWESPDIFLTHPNHTTPPGDLYITDPPGSSAPYNNTINVDVRNKGSHPVRVYSLGIELFKTGMGSTNETHVVCSRVPASGMLHPMDLADIGTPADRKDTFEWNTLFEQGTTHECIKAKAGLVCSEADITAPGFSWAVTAEQSEGQRNTDEMPIAPSPPTPSPKPIRRLQGRKEHVLGLKNRFNEPRRFLLVFPPDYEKYKDILELGWFVLPPDGDLEPVQAGSDRIPHIPFALKGGESRELLVRAEIRPGFDIAEGVRLPFEILVQGDWDNARPAAFAADLPNVAAVAGFTLVVKKASSTLRGIVKDKGGKPVAGARVLLRTVNDRQGTVIRTDEDGRFVFPEINPDVYRLWTEAGGWRSPERILVLAEGKEEEAELALTEQAPATGRRVKVILDKIRVLNDHDPILKGRGELTFTSVVVPDNDESAKQVTRLPAIGVYKVCDKPGRNEIRLEVTLFDGLVGNCALSIAISGKEIDLFDPNDKLNRYHREFCGDPEIWSGMYYPCDEYLDREDVGDWALWYRIVLD